jgi:hypothetical protein
MFSEARQWKVIMHIIQKKTWLTYTYKIKLRLQQRLCRFLEINSIYRYLFKIHCAFWMHHHVRDMM